MENKHAAEQWEIHDSGDRYPEIHPAGDTDGMVIIADVIQRDKAPLIAAAPDLLAALTEAVRVEGKLAEHAAVHAGMGVSEWESFVPSWWSDARAALASARGE